MVTVYCPVCKELLLIRHDTSRKKKSITAFTHCNVYVMITKDEDVFNDMMKD